MEFILITIGVAVGFSLIGYAAEKFGEALFPYEDDLKEPGSGPWDSI